MIKSKSTKNSEIKSLMLRQKVFYSVDAHLTKIFKSSIKNSLSEISRSVYCRKNKVYDFFESIRLFYGIEINEFSRYVLSNRFDSKSLSYEQGFYHLSHIIIFNKIHDEIICGYYNCVTKKINNRVEEILFDSIKRYSIENKVSYCEDIDKYKRLNNLEGVFE